MARLPRLSIADLPHLLVQRGHNRQSVFIDDEDRQLFRALLAEAARAEKVALHAYALRDDEVWLLATPPDAQALGRLMQVLGRRYGAAFNRRHGRTGSLWAGRFRATVIEPERHLLDAMCLVETDGAAALRDGLPTTSVGASSLQHHLGDRHDPAVSDHALYWALGNTPFDREAVYRKRISEGLSSRIRDALTEGLEKGWPVGADGFLASLAQMTTRRLAPLKRGRPPKKETVPN